MVDDLLAADIDVFVSGVPQLSVVDCSPDTEEVFRGTFTGSTSDELAGGIPSLVMFEGNGQLLEEGVEFDSPPVTLEEGFTQTE